MTRSSSDAPVSESRPSRDELVEQLAVVHHFVVAAELRVVVLDHVEAVRALRDDLLDAHRVERLDVLHREHLEDVLVAGAAGLVAVAELARTEDREVDARALEQLRERAARLLVAVVEAARAADEVEVLVVERRAGLDDLDAFELVGPVAALALVEAVRVAGVLHRPVRVAELGREVALHQREVAAHVEDLVEDLDVDRADLVARLAARARPDLLGRDALEHAVGATRRCRRRRRPAATPAASRSRPSPRRPSTRSRAGRAACRSRARGTPTCSVRTPCTRRCRRAAST